LYILCWQVRFIFCYNRILSLLTVSLFPSQCVLVSDHLHCPLYIHLMFLNLWSYKTFCCCLCTLYTLLKSHQFKIKNLDQKQYLFSNFNIVCLFLFCVYFAFGNNVLLLLHFKFTTILDGDECTASCFDHFTKGERTCCTHVIEDCWMAACLNVRT
jgi:hypothetical protein